MTVKVAINGFGRIGRLALRSIVELRRDDIEVVAINDLGPVATLAHLLKYDSVHGPFQGSIATGEDWIDIGSGKIKVFSERDPSKLPHNELGVDVALECTGLFTSKEKADDIKAWIGVVTAVIGALGTLFAFANKYLDLPFGNK